MKLNKEAERELKELKETLKVANIDDSIRASVEPKRFMAMEISTMRNMPQKDIEKWAYDRLVWVEQGVKKDYDTKLLCLRKEKEEAIEDIKKLVIVLSALTPKDTEGEKYIEGIIMRYGFGKEKESVVGEKE